jgi:hypothetical protein
LLTSEEARGSFEYHFAPLRRATASPVIKSSKLLKSREFPAFGTTQNHVDAGRPQAHCDRCAPIHVALLGVDRCPRRFRRRGVKQVGSDRREWMDAEEQCKFSSVAAVIRLAKKKESWSKLLIHIFICDVSLTATFNKAPESKDKLPPQNIEVVEDTQARSFNLV